MTVTINCDGRRLNERQARALLSVLGEQQMMETMRQNGFTLLPMRAPKRLQNGNLVLRYAWRKADGNLQVTMRGTLTLIAPAVL